MQIKKCGKLLLWAQFHICQIPETRVRLLVRGYNNKGRIFKQAQKHPELLCDVEKLIDLDETDKIILNCLFERWGYYLKVCDLNRLS